jgi:Xaa-Pro aminopeptidase
VRPTPQALLRRARLPTFLVTNPVHVRYLTGCFSGSGEVLVTPRRFFLFVDDFTRPLADRTARTGVSVRSVRDLPRMLETIRRCGCEAEAVTVQEKASWRRAFPRTKFIPVAGLVQAFRRTKETDEIANIRRALKITDELLRRVPASLRRSTTEERLARDLEIWALELGADGLAFPPIVAFGTNTSFPHHAATSRKLKRGHVVQIDVGAKYRGYCADRSEVFFTAKQTPLQKNVYACLRETQRTAIKRAKEGTTTHELDDLSRAIIRRHGFEEGILHSLGHGVGLEIHEGVTLSKRKPSAPLLSHEVITVEPGLYFPGRFGMRLEQTVFVA